MKLDDFLLGLKRSDRWLCSQAWRRVGLLNPVPDSCHPLGWPLSSAAIRKHLITSSLIYGAIWRAVFQSHRTFEMFQYMHFHCSNLQVRFNKNAIICAMWTQGSSSFKYKWQWCCTSRHYVYLCVYLVLVITWHVCSCRTSEILISFTLLTLSLERLTFDF